MDNSGDMGRSPRLVEGAGHDGNDHQERPGEDGMPPVAAPAADPDGPAGERGLAWEGLLVAPGNAKSRVHVNTQSIFLLKRYHIRKQRTKHPPSPCY